MKWFKHDSNANMDAKLKRVRMKYGMAGYGLYWYCIEMIAGNIEKNNITFELEHDAEIISFDTGINVEVVNEMMAYMISQGLFEQNNNKITCLKLAKRLDDTTSRNVEVKQIQNSLRTNSEETTELPRRESEQKRIEENRRDKNKEKPLSSKLDDTPQKAIEYLNQKTGKKFKSVESNLKFIKARINEGYVFSDLCWVVDAKVSEWQGTKDDKYLRPATLFNAEKFNQYIGEKGKAGQKQSYGVLL